SLNDFHYVGEIRPGINVLTAKVTNTNTTTISFIINATYNESRLYAIGSIPYVPLPSENPEQAALVNYMTSSTGLDLFRQFFPIVALYLVYIYIAKPRSQGALEFLLARPITRKDVFITRYLAGILVIAVSTTLFYVTVAIVIYAIMGITLKPTAHILMYSGLLLSMITYYGLFYLLATLTSGGKYLALSIVTYVFYWIILPILATLYVLTSRPLGSGAIVEIAKLQYQLYYLSPSGIYSLLVFYVYKDYGIKTILGVSINLLEEIVNPWLVSISILMWIMMPAIIAWFIFKKANLSS
ncbi:MAG: ABC transporter permease subunit, partial [Desulfurococcaceae archaeon]